MLMPFSVTARVDATASPSYFRRPRTGTRPWRLTSDCAVGYGRSPRAIVGCLESVRGHLRRHGRLLLCGCGCRVGAALIVARGGRFSVFGRSAGRRALVGVASLMMRGLATPWRSFVAGLRSSWNGHDSVRCRPQLCRSDSTSSLRA